MCVGIFGIYLQKLRKTTSHLNQELEFNRVINIMHLWRKFFRTDSGPFDSLNIREGVQLLFPIVGVGLMPSFCDLSDELVGSKRQILLNGRLRAIFNGDPQVIQHGSLRLWISCYMETETSLYWVKCYFNVQT